MKNKQTARRQLTVRFIGLFALILLLLNLIFILLSLGVVYENLEERTDDQVEMLADNYKNGQSWQQIVSLQNEDEPIKVTLADGTAYYSEDAREVMDEKVALPFFKHLISADDDYYFYQREKMGGTTLEIAVNSQAMIDITQRLLLMNSLLSLCGLVIGSLLIYLLVGRWSRKLSQMADELKHLTGKEELTVPQDPREMNQLAAAFNDLLAKQRQAIQREQQFVTDASHELKTPIAAIRGHVNLIKRRGEDHPEVIPQSMDFIDKESQRMARLSEQLLTLGRAEQQVPTENIDFSHLVIQEVEKIQAITQREIILAVEPQIFLTAQKTDLQQILHNLLDNALKYAPTGEIRIGLKQTDSICLQIADQGIGIAADQKEKIFERLYRIDQARSRAIEGSGIGLAIVQTLVKKYQGIIKVSDNSPQGTIFTLYFPRK